MNKIKIQKIKFIHNGESKFGHVYGSYLVGLDKRMLIKTEDGNKVIIKESEILGKY